MQRKAQCGVALVVAMVILSLVTTLAANMVWQQWRAVQVEFAERRLMQLRWMLSSALDWGRLILREDAGPSDHWGEPWAVPLAEVPLTSFLAADRDDNADSGPEATLSATISDAQSRYNLNNLAVSGELVPAELDVLKRLCDKVGVSSEVADIMAEGLRVGWRTPEFVADGTSSFPGPLRPVSTAQLTWLGIDEATAQRLRPYVALLPSITPINLNTAPREVLVAVLGVDLDSAERLVQARRRSPFHSVEEAGVLVVSPDKPLDANRVAVSSSYFEISGRVRLEKRVLQERFLVMRRDREVVLIRREPRNVSTADL